MATHPESSEPALPSEPADAAEPPEPAEPSDSASPDEPSERQEPVPSSSADQPPAAGVISRATVVRAVAVLAAVFVFQVVFAISYIGAFHDPGTESLPFGVVASPPELADVVVSQIQGGDTPVDARPVASRGDARAQLLDQEIYGAIVFDATGTEDELLIASATSVNIAESIEAQVAELEAGLGRTVRVEDVAPLPQADSRGLVPFYLALAWVVGGYLGATVLSLAGGMFVTGLRHALLRMGALLGYALSSGFLLALVVDAAYGVVPGQLLATTLVGALVVGCVALTTAALQALFGMAGTAIVLVLFVALGSPSSGGPAARLLLPDFWAWLGPILPNGAGTDALRAVFYLDGHGLGTAVVTLLAWAAAGAAVMILARHRGRPGPSVLELSAASGVAAG